MLTHNIQPILQKLREKALAAVANAHLPDTTNGYSSEPSVKSEPNELSTLNGMTRLVSQKSPTSTSYDSASPASQPASPMSLAINGSRFVEPPMVTNVASWDYSAQIPAQQTYPESAYRTFSTMEMTNIPMDTLHGYFGYPVNNAYSMQTLTPPEDTPSPHQHQFQQPIDSWHNFFSPYNPLS